ncbi:MAG: hypothetical protein MUO99_05715 [Dehalococcoidales bacterium]|nr:hypothetical protein [Dehalococcoidales bacterium]
MSEQKGKAPDWLRPIMTCLLSILVLASLLVVSGCAEKEAQPEPQIPPHYTTFTDEAGLFSISFPPDWEPALSQIPDLEEAVKDVITSIDSGAPVEKVRAIFLAGLPIETGYVPNVSIAVESLPGVIWTHDRAVEAEIRGIKQIVQDYHEFSRLKTTVDGREATIIDGGGGLTLKLVSFTICK